MASNKTPRRPRGEGSIRHEGDRWIVRLRVAGRQQKRVTRTQADALEALAELKRDASLPVPRTRYTVGDALDDFVHHGTHSRGWTASTLRSYQSAIDLHLRPALGKARLADLSVRDVQRALDRLLADGHSGRHVAHVRGVLRSVIAHAERQELVSRNVAALAASPPVRRQEVRALSAAELARLFAGLEGEPLKPAIVLMATMGLRRGEAIALRWGDVDFERKELTIRRTGTVIKGEYVEGPPKSARSRRTLSLPDAIVAMLRPGRGLPAAHCFPGAMGGPVSEHAVRLALGRGLERAKLPHVRVHDLRHSAISALLAAGGSLVDAQALAGHASISLTADLYSHYLPTQRRATAERINGVFGAALGGRS